jgi:two-component system response regulator YesN
MKAIRVVLADEHPVVRVGIRNELRAAGIEVVGEAADGEEALRLVERLQPDVLMLDVELPGLSGLEVVRRLRSGALSSSV